MLEKIVEKVPDEVVKADLGKYRQYVMELGADDAEIITRLGESLSQTTSTGAKSEADL